MTFRLLLYETHATLQPHSKDNLLFVLFDKMLFLGFRTKLREGKIFLGNFCLSWLQRPLEHDIFTNVFSVVNSYRPVAGGYLF